MGGLGHILEGEGLATTQISLIREHTEVMRPPRALWVPFVLGRPLGQPGDAAFQTRVLRAGLQLVEAPSGPVLEDYSEEAEGIEESEPWVCPVSFPRQEDDSPAERLRREVQQLQTWYDISIKETGRTTFGASRLPIEKIAGLLNDLASADAVENPNPDLEFTQTLRLAGEDMKAFYTEALLAQPGQAKPHELRDWFWSTTQAAETIIAARNRLRDRGENAMVQAAEFIIPKELR